MLNEFQKVLTAEEILGATDRPPDRLMFVPEWGGKVILRALTAAERDEWEASMLDDAGQPRRRDMRARLLVFCLVDATGRRLFTLDQLVALGARSGAVIERLARAAMRMNKLRAEDVEAAEGNLPGGPAAASSSPSPASSA